jgi:hypothetical protein
LGSHRDQNVIRPTWRVTTITDLENHLPSDRFESLADKFKTTLVRVVMKVQNGETDGKSTVPFWESVESVVVVEQV